MLSGPGNVCGKPVCTYQEANRALALLECAVGPTVVGAAAVVFGGFINRFEERRELALDDQRAHSVYIIVCFAFVHALAHNVAAVNAGIRGDA